MQHIFLVFGAVLVASALADHQTPQSEWKYLTRENFTALHNWELIKGHVKGFEDLRKAINRKSTRDISLDDTIFTLYTRNGPAKGVRIHAGDAASLIEGKFDENKPTVISTHGFLSGGTSDWMVQMKTAQLSVLDANFITIDWSDCAHNILYPVAVDCTKTIGKYLADLIDYLGQQGADVRGMHLIGHSLGAHAMAQVANYGIRVNRITGCDPAGPLFDADDLAGRIDPSDADVVDIIHTSTLFGYDGLLGHYDFFPNGGSSQPHCIDSLCSHSMSHDYYIDTIYRNSKYPAMQCNSLDDANDGKCSGTENYMGVLSPNGSKGIYYLQVDKPASAEP